MEQQEILKKLQLIFQDVLENNHLVIDESSCASNTKGWDSLSHIEIISAIEDDFNITFTSKEILGWANVGEIIHSIQKHLE